MQKIVFVIAVVYQHDEVGNVKAGFAAGSIRHGEAESLVFDVRENLGMRFDNAAELGFPVAIADSVVNRTAARVSLVSFFGGREVDVGGGSGGVVGRQDCSDWVIADVPGDDARVDALAGFVGKLSVEQLRRHCSAFAAEVAVSPLLCNVFELAVEVEFGIANAVSPLRFQQVIGEVISHGCRAGAQVFHGQVDAFADNAFVARDGCAHEVLRER